LEAEPELVGVSLGIHRKKFGTFFLAEYADSHFQRIINALPGRQIPYAQQLPPVWLSLLRVLAFW
jgi:hypothetical protein